MRTTILIASASIVGASIYFKEGPKTIEHIKVVEVPKVEVVTNTVKIIEYVEKPVLVKPDIVYLPAPTNWEDEMLNGVKYFEGYRANTYTCCGGVKTIGYGCTDKQVVALGAITEHKASDILEEELKQVREKVLEEVKIDLKDYQINALTSFAFNCGMSNLQKLINGEDRLNSGNLESVEELMPMYRKAGGKVREGLEKRRAWEVSLWKGEPVY